MMRQAVLFLGLICVFGLQGTPGHAQTDRYIHASRLGITHISAANRETPELRYQQALTLGAGWNRWPLYWDWVQTAPDTWDWSGYDRQVAEDLQHGLEIDAILLGRPEFYADEFRIQGMYTPIFADGTDTPGEGKQLNPDNPWVHFVYQAVNRYKPNGVLARQGSLPPAQGIRIWEVWNEPDVDTFWKASVNDYARLLKMSYIVIKMADPNAQVMFGGLLFATDGNWLAGVLNIFINDPMRLDYNWFMDIIAVHSYGDPWRSGWLTLFAEQSLIAFDLVRPIWVTESGVPVWDDYPGPTWESTSPNRATQDQQAWYFIQSTAYAWANGADKVFLHQLYDDCGDQPAGTDFPPHNGDLCNGGFICAGDAHGVYRNLPDADCFTQHPNPGSPRLIADAYRLMAEVFGRNSFENGRQRELSAKFATLMFDRPRSNERITVMWNRTIEEDTLLLPAVSDSATLLSINSNHTVVPLEDYYRIILPPALPDVDYSASPYGGVAIGGEPFILIETVTRSEPVPVEGGPTLAPRPTITPTLDIPTLPPPVPTLNPAYDATPPIALVFALPEISEPVFEVSWEGIDESGIANFLIWVRVDGGDWQPWVNTQATSAVFTGEAGHTYEFAAWAVDLADNWSENIDLVPQATTRVE
jgi:hypothetical protein